VHLVDFDDVSNNDFVVANQFTIIENGHNKRPDIILFINGLPLVVFEFKSAIREDATVHDAYNQLTIRYRRDIPELFKYNAFCVISDGVNNKAGSFFAPYDFFYAWRRVEGLAKDGVNLQGRAANNRVVHFAAPDGEIESLGGQIVDIHITEVLNYTLRGELVHTHAN
jgi:type I restriction enzyme R subunit